MARVWLRLELFELGLLPLPLKYATTLTVGHVKRSLDALHVRFQEQHAPSGMDIDATMSSPRAGSTPTTMADDPMEFTDGGFVESDNLNTITYSCWKEAVEHVFQWREQDYKAFWLLLVYFHRKIPVKESFEPVVLDEEHCFLKEEVPVFKIAIFLFIQTVKPHSWRAKHALESFNAVWYRENAVAPNSEQPSPGSMSPQLKGGASPPPPSSPHTMGMQDRSTSDAYYLSFVREKLDDLFQLLFPSLELKEDSHTIVSADHIDFLGFLLAGVGTHDRLSAAYPHWNRQSSVAFAESGVKICKFLKKHLFMNEALYPPVSFSLSGSGSHVSLMHPFPGVNELSLSDDRLLEESAGRSRSQTDDDQETAALCMGYQKPIVYSGLNKTTIIKRPEEFADDSGRADLVIFSCHDTFFYILGPVRHVMITACNNCRIVVGPSTGIFSMDRCENVHVSAISGLIRVSNCLDSTLNTYTLVPIVMTGENVGIQLGPYNTKYAGLPQQLIASRIAFRSDAMGTWNSFLNLESDDDRSEAGEAKESITLQPTNAYRDICVPVKLSSTTPADRPFPIPSEYTASLKSQQETVEKLRKLVCSDEFDLSTKRTMETVIQMRFKEWLALTGNVRQILDLVQIEKARSGSHSNQSSPTKQPTPQ